MRPNMGRMLLLVVVSSLCVGRSHSQSVPNSFAYVLQADALDVSRSAVVERLATCGRDWIVLDARFATDAPWESDELEKIRRAKDGRKIMAYVSIGEAEDYRPYWRSEWVSRRKPSAAAPPWLLQENPQWRGNYRVKYWNPEWQQIILGAIDEVTTLGFDGIYLDIVDGFEAFEKEGNDYIDDRINPETRQSFRRDMVDWVKIVAARIRVRNSAALVVPQNGSQLLADDDFVASISAIGLEDLFTLGNPSSPNRTPGSKRKCSESVETAE